MDATRLPFDAEAMLAGLNRWVACESPTFDAAAVNRMLDVASREMAVAGARLDLVPGQMGYADCVRAAFPHSQQGGPGILVMGHFDTVHPVGTAETLRIRREGPRAYGRGILDMKGGSDMVLETLRPLQR